MFHVKGVFRLFLPRRRAGGTQVLHFVSVSFSGKVSLTQIEEQKWLWGGPEASSPENIFEDLDHVMAILVLFKQFLKQVLFKLFGSLL